MPRTLTLASNRSSAAASVGQIAARARLQLSARAYLHHYEAHGVEAGYLREQLECAAPRGRREGWGRGRAGRGRESTRAALRCRRAVAWSKSSRTTRRCCPYSRLLRAALEIKSSLDTKALDTISEEADPRGGEH